MDSGIDMVRISVEALTEKDYKSICDVDLDFDRFAANIRNLYEISRGTGTKVSVKALNVALRDKADADKFYYLHADFRLHLYSRHHTGLGGV